MMHGPRKTAPIIAGGEIKRLPIDLLHLDFQPEENLVPETVEEYALQLQQGGSVLPVRVYFDGEQYWLNDGFHRVAAARKVGILEIDAEVQPGTYADMEAEWKRFLRTLKDDLRRAH